MSRRKQHFGGRKTNPGPEERHGANSPATPSISIGWLYDRPGYIGGAELTEQEFRNAAPEGAHIIECLPGRVARGCDVYVIHNSVTYSLDDYRAIPSDRPVFRFWNDVGSWLSEDARAWLDAHARPICISPIQAEYMGYADPILIPPPVDLARFHRAAERVNGNRSGTISVGSWRNRGKGAHAVQRWAIENRVDVEYVGGGAFAPQTSREIAYEGMPAILAAHETFVFLPEVIEPFGRCVAEAWAAGCEIVTNELVGAAYWIRENPGALETAAEDFWRAVLNGEADTARQVRATANGQDGDGTRGRGAPDGHGRAPTGQRDGMREAAGQGAADQIGQAAR